MEPYNVKKNNNNNNNDIYGNYFSAITIQRAYHRRSL